MKKIFTFAIMAVLLIGLGGREVAAAPPDVSFYWPTPDDEATITEPSVQIMALITEPDLAEVTFEWQLADYNLYDNSLVLMFNFNNVEGLGEYYETESLVVDISGAGNHGELGGAAGVPTWQESSRFGGGFAFDGEDSIIVMHNPDGSLDPGSGDFAIALWILTRENIDADIIRKGSTYTTDGMWYKLEHSPGQNGNNKISLNFNTNGTDATIFSTDSYADYDWHFVVAQRKGNQAELWVDGVLNGTAAVTGEIYNEANLTLGSKDTQDDDFLKGHLDEVRIWMRSFSADEVQLLYDSNLSKFKYVAGATEWTLDVRRDGLVNGDYTFGISATNASAETGSDQRTFTVALPAPPDVTLVSPADGSILNNTTVTFTVDAADPVGLANATLYVGSPEETVIFSGPDDTDDAQIYGTDDSSTGPVEGPDTNAGDAVSINVDGSNPHAHAVIKFPNLIGAGAGQVPSNTEVISATLQVNCFNSGALMQVYRVTSDWSETTVTWNSPWTSAGGDYDDTVVVDGDCTAIGLRTIDITEFVQAWSDGTANYGILLTDTGATDGVDFDSSEGGIPPVLTVVYAGDWQPVQTQSLSGDSDTATFADVVLEDETDYIWNCLVTNLAEPPMASWAASNFSLSIDGQTPDEPVLVGPADGATNVAVPVTLEVTVSDPQPSDVLDVTFYGRKGVSSADDFTIVVLPDTQYYSQSYPDIFTAQTEWIVNNIDSLNTVFVTHEGDIVQNPGSTVEWERANTSMTLLDGVVPYGVLPGNHDMDTSTREAPLYNSTFPYTRYDQETWYGGHCDDEQNWANNNNYQLFSAGGIDFVILHLEYNPRGEVITWADGVLKAHADRIAIITTHAYIDTSANRLSEAAGIWSVLVQGNDNVYFVLCGHKHGEARRTDPVNGREVHQVLACYQSRAHGGDGWLRIMRFSPMDNAVYVETYSPTLDLYETDSSSQFSLDVPLNWYVELGTNTGVASDTNTSIDWPDLAEESEYEWYVTVTDPTDRTAVGPVWSFTTGQDPKASNPSPVDGAIQVATDAVLSWTAGVSAQWHDVYFGTDETAVTNADTTTPGIYQVRQDVGNESYTPSPSLVGNTTYYWRIDEFDGTTIHTGDVWSFTTLNQPPVAVDDAYSVDEDNTLSVAAFGVLTNDTDAEGETLTAVLVDDVANGTLTLNSDGSFSYTPDADFFGSDTFTYKANDGTSDSDPATVIITVEPVPDVPVANDDSAATVRDVPVAIDVLANDTDADGDDLTVTNLIQPSHGIATLEADQKTVTYTPESGYTGGDSFTYTVSDGQGGTDSATVTVEVSEPYVDYAAYGESPVFGTVAGSYTDTQAKDGSYEVIEEALNRTNKNGYSILEHKWLFDVPGSGPLSFHVNAYRDNYDSADNFVFAYSTDDLTYTDMLTVTKTTDDGMYQTYTLPGSISGTVYIRVSDTDHTNREQVLGQIHVDHMFIRRAIIVAPPEQASNPSPADGAVDVAVGADLSWTAGTGAESHDVWFGTDAGSLSLVSEGQSGTTFDPGTLATNTTYYWRIDEENSFGTTTGVVWSFTTKTSSGEVYVCDIEMGSKKAGPNYSGLATVWVKDDVGADVEGATVSGVWSGAVESTATGVTGSDGKVILRSSNKRGGGTFTFTITDVVASGYTYNASLNVETSDSITVP